MFTAHNVNTYTSNSLNLAVERLSNFEWQKMSCIRCSLQVQRNLCLPPLDPIKDAKLGKPLRTMKFDCAIVTCANVRF